MQKVILLFLLVFLAACGRSEEPSKDVSSEAELSTVDELVSNPERLKNLREQCKRDRSNLRGVRCDQVAEATRKRFYGDGKIPYTPSNAPPKF
ncbi:EexN family lipoprotein [uncultured Castellaniella sp.]|uniref:EexN family lipoprotein n=1 Tax=uncultured Castellaniella sp. TaxID=647907 RepID=UPI002615A470|nr:EexN family lipoprotein [uncultured Castellaniella sp.]